MKTVTIIPEAPSGGYSAQAKQYELIEEALFRQDIVVILPHSEQFMSDETMGRLAESIRSVIEGQVKHG